VVKEPENQCLRLADYAAAHQIGGSQATKRQEIDSAVSAGPGIVIFGCKKSGKV
jgi:hypothetical protein